MIRFLRSLPSVLVHFLFVTLAQSLWAASQSEWPTILLNIVGVALVLSANYYVRIFVRIATALGTIAHGLYALAYLSFVFFQSNSSLASTIASFILFGALFAFDIYLFRGLRKPEVIAWYSKRNLPKVRGEEENLAAPFV